ncbi:MAG TPA: sigma 54-interacting transcriptional regulator [Opitutaceae bacterium]
MTSLFLEAECEFADAVVRLNASNPFLPERIACERAALGNDFVAAGAEWNKLPPATTQHPNHTRLTARAGDIIERVRTRWPKDGRGVGRADAARYEELAGFWLYQTYSLRFDTVIREALASAAGHDGRVAFYAAFKADAERCFVLPGLALLEDQPVSHLFACAFQIRRAFHHIFRSLVGGSAPMARLRAGIWQSIFSHDLNRYRRVLHARMGDFATLITGPSGTGKELVARAIALSRYLPFDPRRGGFIDGIPGAFFPLNLSALSPTLIESELFGHRRGAFTGALADRSGWMEVCPAVGAVFLDEIGDVEAGIQVKLLRVLQSRTFQRLGDTETRQFQGKIIAATNRDLPAEIRAGRFREDFYYRLCSDLIRTPSLREQLDAEPGDLAVLIDHIVRRMLGDDDAAEFAREAADWISLRLGTKYAWPGNFRELEQCLRNLVVRGDYRPAGPLAPAAEDWNALIGAGRLTAEELLCRYTRLVHAQANGNVEETARRLDLDRRTVKARLGR